MSQTLDRVKSLIAKFESEKNEEIFPLCVMQVAILYSREPEPLHALLFNLIKRLLVSKHPFQRSLAASLFEKITDKMIEHQSTDVFMFPVSVLKFNMQEFVESLEKQKREKGKPESNYDRFVALDLLTTTQDGVIKFLSKKDNFLFSKSEKSIQAKEKLSRLKLTGEADDEYIEQINNQIEREGDLESIMKEVHADDKRVKQSLLEGIDESDGQSAPERVASSKMTSIFDAIYEIARVLVFNVNWEYRHGALLVFRAVSRKFGRILSFFGEQRNDGTLKIERDDMGRVTKLNGRTVEETSRLLNEDMKHKCLILLSLDRFSDFLNDKSNMTHRALGGEILVTLFVNIPNVEQFFFIFEFLFLPNRRFDWEPRQAFIFLLKKLLEKDNERHKAHKAHIEHAGSHKNSHSSIKHTGVSHAVENDKPLMERKFMESMSKMVLEIIMEHEEITDISAQYGTALAESRYWPINPNYSNLFQAKLVQKLQEMDDIGYLPKAVFEHFTLMLSTNQLSPQVYANVEQMLRKFIFHDNADVRQELFVFIGALLSQQTDKLASSNLYFIFVATVFHFLSRLSQMREEQTISVDSTKETDQIIDVLKKVIVRAATSNQRNEMLAIVFAIMDKQDFKSAVESLSVKFEYNIEKPLAIKLHDVLELTTRMIDSLTQIQVAELFHFLKPKIDQNAFVLAPFMLCDSGVMQISDERINSFLEGEIDQINFNYVNSNVARTIDTLDNFLCDEMSTLQLDVSPTLEGLVASTLGIVSESTNHKAQAAELQELLTQTARELTSLMEAGTISATKINLVIILRQKLIPMFKQIVDFSIESTSLVKLAGAYAYLQKCVLGATQMDSNKNNKIIQPLMSVCMDPLSIFFAQVCSNTLYKYVKIYKGIEKHPNHKIISSVLKKATESPIFCQNMRVYFKHIFSDFTWMAIVSFPSLSAIFDSEAILAEYADIVAPIRSTQGTLAFKNELMTFLKSKLTVGSENYRKVLCTVFEELQKDVVAGKIAGMEELLMWLLSEIQFRKVEAFLALKALLEKSRRVFVSYAKIFLKETIKAINESYEGEKSVVFDVFSSMLSLSHFDTDVHLATNMRPELAILYEEGRRFLFEFKNPSNFDVDLEPVLNNSLQKFALRDYQVEGVKWVSFLFRYGLSACLCDDMGLGKTIQSLCAVALAHVHSVRKHDDDQNESRPVSLIVCPNNLMTHWSRECSTYIKSSVLKPCFLMGGSITAEQPMSHLVAENPECTLYITSYNIMNRIRDFIDVKFKVAVIDEAHLIRNPKNKTSKSVRSLKAEVRLALTGTPIQNKITEIWSIFDFLIPMYLGKNEDFNKEFKSLLEMSLLTIDLSKMHLNEAQQATLNRLHKKVLPFIMRREKSDVLKDLPDKIIQDYYCEMSDVQRTMYEQLAKDFKPEQQNEYVEIVEENTEKQSFFSVLAKMRKVLNHPSLLDEKALKKGLKQKKKTQKRRNSNDEEDDVISDTQAAPKPVQLGRRANPEAEAIDPRRDSSTLGFYEQSGKFVALKDLLKSLDFSEDDLLSCTGNTNKMLVFTRSNDTLEVLRAFYSQTFPFLKFLCLQNSQNQFQRAEVVDQFNKDAEIKALLLTPKIGGLGLNLHTANVVIMFDHDFNPMNDLQAMDRAHRLGQKNVVNVFRLITLGTVEEQILGIQRFKLSVARTIVNAENTSIRNVQDSNFLKLIDDFAQQNIVESEKDQSTLAGNLGAYSRYLKELEMDANWDEDEYTKEYLEEN